MTEEERSGFEWLIEQAIAPVGKAEHPMRGVMADAVESLPKGYREALEMWAWEGLTYGQIAEELGLAGRSSGHKRVLAALRMLKVRLSEEGITYD